MPIFSVGSTSDLLGQNGGRRNGYSDESAQAEWFLYEFLIKHLRLTEPDARQTIVSVIDAGEDLVELALGIIEVEATKKVFPLIPRMLNG